MVKVGGYGGHWGCGGVMAQQCAGGTCVVEEVGVVEPEVCGRGRGCGEGKGVWLR